MRTRKSSLITELLILKNTSQATYITMKLMLIFVFVFSLGILTLLAEKIPQHRESGERALSDDSSGINREKRSPGVFNFFYWIFPLDHRTQKTKCCCPSSNAESLGKGARIPWVDVSYRVVQSLKRKVARRPSAWVWIVERDHGHAVEFEVKRVKGIS